MSAHPPTSRFPEYWSAVDWLLSLIQDPAGLRYFAPRTPAERLVEMRQQIPRLKTFLDFIGNPQTSFRTIHIAGTSGKGSVTLMLAAILEKAGVRSGHHVSPYLQICNEKLACMGKPVGPTDFVALVSSFRRQYLEWQASNQNNFLKYGEAWVALTFMYFAHQQVEWVILETGMGGRFDPTNIIQSDLTLITNVDLDHTESLGHTLEEIAWHKAGIIKPHRPVVSGVLQEAARGAIAAEAQAQSAELYEYGRDFTSRIVTSSDETRLEIETPFGQHSLLSPDWLRSRHQQQNAAAAICALDILQQQGALSLESEHIQAGLQALKLPGRFETVQTNPRLILDGAHNPAKVASLCQEIKDKLPGEKLTVVFGMLATKDAPTMLRALLPLVKHWYLTQPAVFGKPALSPQVLLATLKEIDPGARATPFETVTSALDAALSETPENHTILVTGSVYLVGEARNRWYPLDEMLSTLNHPSNSL